MAEARGKDLFFLDTVGRQLCSGGSREQIRIITAFQRKIQGSLAITAGRYSDPKGPDGRQTAAVTGGLGVIEGLESARSQPPTTQWRETGLPRARSCDRHQARAGGRASSSPHLLEDGQSPLWGLAR
ncbi:hypothetical protein SKAU_G00352660 [Synaphobranchus kaupii]|uniref:Uncharacterized protein n=1 Tax=Synaphobranchus kaupii TaxID=118154 RepID=A0A9Q1IG58_SYNKA|nr:hypothetical protein SKAU_G00352660 [Synaphobranchus kaupii]